MEAALPTIYVVSLARAVDRRARMIDRLSGEELPFALVDAYEGTDPIVRDRASEGCSDATLRVVACLASHLRALEQFLASTASEAIICEDDVRPCREFVRRFGELRDNVPDDAPLIALGYLVWHWDGFLWAGTDVSKENLTTIGADLWGTQMYLVRRAWAAECAERFGIAIDDRDVERRIPAVDDFGMVRDTSLWIEDRPCQILDGQRRKCDEPSPEARLTRDELRGPDLIGLE